MNTTQGMTRDEIVAALTQFQQRIHRIIRIHHVTSEVDLDLSEFIRRLESAPVGKYQHAPDGCEDGPCPCRQRQEEEQRWDRRPNP